MRRRYRLFAEDSEWEGGSTVRGKASLTTVLKLILAAAIITAPLYIVGESFDLSHAGRVLLINGSTAGTAIILIFLAQRGYARLVSALLVLAMYALITSLAATSGEPIHVNVVNFVLILVLANLLCSGRAVAIVTLACASAMVGIAYYQSLMATGGQGREVFVETVVQFLPQFIFMAVLLRMTSARANARDQE